MARLFLNYRRDETEAWADRLHEKLSSRFGAANVFLDVDGKMPVGVDFVAYLGAQVVACDAMVAVIGPRWLEEIRRREREGEPDFVRIELEAALTRDIPVAPVLVGDAQMPREADLPDSLKGLARRQALRVGRGPEFDPAVKRLIEGLEAAIGFSGAAAGGTPAAGAVFRDALTSGGHGSEMVSIPGGSFVMGSPPGEPERNANEGPQREVRVPAFALGKYAVTFEEYDAYCVAKGVTKPGDEGWGRGRLPVLRVSWDEAQGYCAWLTKETGATYRLPTEAEWEYACRAGTTTRYWWGDQVTAEQANFGNTRKRTVVVEAFAPNPFGLHQMHGNVWEWCQDESKTDYVGAPTDGSAWTLGDKTSAVVRGGSGFSNPQLLRSAFRSGSSRGFRNGDIGFRVARTFTP